MRLLLLIDQPLDGDRRVQTGLAAYQAAGADVTVLDILQPPRGTAGQVRRARLAALCHLVKRVVPAVLRGLSRLKAMIRDHRALDYPGWTRFGAGKAAVRETLGAYAEGYGAALASPDLRPDVIHANDLRALSFALGFTAVYPARIVYDSHELALFRNRRKQSWLRLLMMYGYEAAGYRAAALTLTVCRPIADWMDQLYGGGPTRLAVNNIYRRQPLALAEQPDPRIAIVYFGAATDGRGIEDLIGLARSNPLIHAGFFFTGNLAENAAWLTGRFPDLPDRVHIQNKLSYLDEVVPYVAGFSKVFSWVIFHDICLSHRHTIGNKLFQSLSFGLPIIAPDVGYMGQVIGQHGLGVVVAEPGAAAEALAGMDDAAYAALREKALGFDVAGDIGTAYGEAIAGVVATLRAAENR